MNKIEQAIGWANKRLELQGKKLDETQIEYLTFALQSSVSNDAVGLDSGFDKWLSDNRWFTYSPVTRLWSYTFEHGTSMSKEAYRKNYMKTTQELYAKFKSEQLKNK